MLCCACPRDKARAIDGWGLPQPSSTRKLSSTRIDRSPGPGSGFENPTTLAAGIGPNADDIFPRSAPVAARRGFLADRPDSSHAGPAQPFGPPTVPEYASMLIKKWSKGERVVHAAKPEWGHGEVLEAHSAQQDGKACQRLVVRFTRAGTKTVSTAFADLRAAQESPFAQSTATLEPAPAPGDSMPASAASTSFDDALAGGLRNPVEIMTRLPDSVTDAFLPLRKRVQAAVSLYKFGETPSGLLDWAAAQTGLKDPMTRFNRHELEDFFSRFKITLDAHLRKLLKDLRKQDPGFLPELQASASHAGQQALRRADMGR